jgi:hypothetical protein
MRLKNQPRWSCHAPSNSADAISAVSFGQAMASANRLVGATNPTNPLATVHRGSTRPHNSVSTRKDHASSPVPAVANTPRRQKGCAAPCCSPLQTPFCERTSLRSLSCGAFARLSAIARVGQLLRPRLERRPASIAELGVLLSETNCYLIRIGDEHTAKSEHVGRAC